jgi:hypothetical protein
MDYTQEKINLGADSRAAYNKGFAIAGFRASQTQLCKVEVQFSEQSLVLKLPAIANPQNVTCKPITLTCET